MSEAFSRSTPDTMTYAEFLEWADEDTLAEWVNGKVVWLEPASYQHQEILAFLGSIVMMFAEERSLGQTLFGLFQMKLENGRLPDLIFVAHNHLNRLTTYYLDGPADLNQFQSENYMRQLWCNVDPILE